MKIIEATSTSSSDAMNSLTMVLNTPSVFMSGPCKIVPVMPPMLKANTAVMPADTGMPAVLSRLGSQLRMK